MAEGSKLINVSSGMGSLEINVNPENGQDAYAMSKAALNMLTRRLAEKLRPKGIIVVSMSPGWVRTDMGGESAPNSVEDAVASMQTTAEALTLEQSGTFMSEKGRQIPW
jgi:NAD(P)-dependent dehydrogenase (short-subunit alcohol dehydrogenase family)